MKVILLASVFLFGTAQAAYFEECLMSGLGDVKESLPVADGAPIVEGCPTFIKDYIYATDEYSLLPLRSGNAGYCYYGAYQCKKLKQKKK